MKKKWLIFILGILGGCLLAEYTCRGEVEIDPATQRLRGDLELGYPASQISPGGEVELLLHRGLIVEDIKGPWLGDYTVMEGNRLFPFAPEARTLKIRLKKEKPKTDKIRLRVRYHGRIGIVSEWEVNRISAEFVELGLYAPWFPFHPGMRPFTFDIRVKVPSDYRVFGNGQASGGAGSFRLRSDRPRASMVLLAAPRYTVREKKQDPFRVQMVFLDAEAILFEEIASLGLDLLRRYGEIFDRGDNRHHQLKMAVVPRKQGGGYVREDFFVLTPIAPESFRSRRVNYLRFFAHEVSHLWWQQAPSQSWEDWLNESFAEYSALRMVRERVGHEAFRALLAEKKEGLEELPPIRGISRESEAAYRVLYDKGCVLLFWLEEKLGSRRMDTLLVRLVRGKVGSTGEFLRCLRQVGGEEIASDFDRRLSK